jgi:Fe-S oxidoreductase
MSKHMKRALAETKDHADCSNCGLCLLVCPMWRKSRDFQHSPSGYAKALQHGTAASEIAEAVSSCTLCAVWFSISAAN